MSNEFENMLNELIRNEKWEGFKSKERISKTIEQRHEETMEAFEDVMKNLKETEQLALDTIKNIRSKREQAIEAAFEHVDWMSENTPHGMEALKAVIAVIIHNM